MRTVSSSHSLTSMSSSLISGLSLSPYPSRKPSSSHERQKVKKRSRKRRNLRHRYGSSKRRRLTYATRRIKEPTGAGESPADSSLSERQLLSNGALDSGTKSTVKGSEKNENFKFARRKGHDVHVGSISDNRITSGSQAAQLDNAEIVCSPASLMPITKTVEPVQPLPCDGVQDSAEGRVLRPRRLRSKESKENLPCLADSSQIVGRRVEVYWPLDAAWYSGFISAYDDVRKKHKVSYDDGEEEWLCLSREKFKFETAESGQVDRTALEGKHLKKVCAFSGDSSMPGLSLLGVTQGVHSKRSSNCLSMPIKACIERPGVGSDSFKATLLQADASTANLSRTEATLGEEITGLKAQKQKKFFPGRHKGTSPDQGRGGTDLDGGKEVKPGRVYLRRQKCGAKERSQTADCQMCGDAQQVGSPRGQKWHRRSNHRRQTKQYQIPQFKDYPVHLYLEKHQDIKNMDSTLILGAPGYRRQPKLMSPTKRNRQSLKEDASTTRFSLEGSVSVLDSTNAVGNTGALVRCESQQPQRRVRKKHKLKSLADTTCTAELKMVSPGPMTEPFNQEQNQRAADESAIFMIAESFGVKHANDERPLSLWETQVPGAGKSVMESSRRKRDLDIQAVQVGKKLVGRQAKGGRKSAGSHSTGRHKNEQTLKKSQRVQKSASSNKLLSPHITANSKNEILVSCSESFAFPKYALNEASSTPCKSNMGSHNGILFSDTSIMGRASCTSDSSVSVGNIVHHWSSHAFVRQHCSTSDLILGSNSCLHLQCPLRAFHSTIHFLTLDMVFGLFTWQLFNMMVAVGLFSGGGFEGKFSWTGSTRDLADVVLLFMAIVKSLPLTSQRCHEHWQGRVLCELWSVVMRKEHWVRSLPAILTPQADDLLMQHLRQIIVGHCTGNVTFRQMLNIFSSYILKPFVFAILCEKGAQLTAVVQQFLLLTCPLGEAISFERQSVKWVKLRSHCGAEADFSSYLRSFLAVKHHCTGTFPFEKPTIDWIDSAAQAGYVQHFIPIPSFKLSSNQDFQFTTTMVDCKKKIPGSNFSSHLHNVGGNFGASSLRTDFLRFIENAREILQDGKFAWFNRFQEFQDFYTRLGFNSMLQKYLYLAGDKSAECHCVQRANTVANKDVIYRQSSLTVDLVEGEGIGKDSFCLQSRQEMNKSQISAGTLLEENSWAAIKEERFLQNCDQFNAVAGSSPFCSMNGLVDNASGSSSSSSYEYTTKWKSTKMAEIRSRRLDLRDQHEQGVYGNSQHSGKSGGSKHCPRGAEQESTGIERLNLCCTANVLITRNNRSWREVGASVVLKSRGSEWVISAQIEGVVRSQKVLESTINSRVNRYTHAVMWKGGYDWTLEFPDRVQWTRFKGMHEECSSRNARAAFMKQIPVPSVKEIQDSIDGKHADCPRFGVIGGRWPGEVQTALNCSTRVYDMDSEDENLLAEVNQRASTEEIVSMDAFERIIDKLERITYLRQGEMVGTDEVAELCENLASKNAVLLVHAYWFNKRRIRENALIRYFESPLWRKYQKQCDSWEAGMNELQQLLPHETKEELQKRCPKPPLFAFCFPSREFDAGNSSKRVQRQRSQKHLNSSFKYSWTSFFETPEESQRIPSLKAQKGHDSLLKYPASLSHPYSVSLYENSDFWQRKMSRDGFFEQLISNLSPRTAWVASHKSPEDVKANAVAARQFAQMSFLRFNSALQRAVAAVTEFETIYFAEHALMNLKCESASALWEQLLFFRRKIEDVLNQFCSLSGKENFLNGAGSHGDLSDDGGEAIDDDDEDNDPVYTISMQADGFGVSLMSDDFLREEGSFLSISEKAHLEAWMRTTLRQRAM